MLQYNPSISGSLSVTGSLIVTNGVIGTVSGVDVQIFSSSINQVITGIQTATGSQEGRLGSIESFTSSTSARLNSIETISASNLSRLNSIETTSASVDNLNTIQNSRLTSLEEKTGSLATTGSNIFFGTQTFSGSVYVKENLIVQGSSSLQNITASAVDIGTNKIILNVSNPSVRYAGISVYDSGSTGGTGSLWWDSVDNHWLYEHPADSGAPYNSAILISGPKNAGNLGEELELVNNFIVKAVGGDHISSSAIYDDGTTISLKSNTEITGSTSFTGLTLTNGIAYLGGSNTLQSTDKPHIFRLSSGGLGISANNEGAGNQPIHMYTSGTQRLSILGDGTIGIGTTNPQSKIHTYASNDRAAIRIQNTAAAKVWELLPASANVANSGFSIYNVTDNTTPFYITDGGSIGIGAATNYTGVKLHVIAGNAKSSTTGNVNAFFSTNTTSDANAFGLRIMTYGGSTISDRYATLQTTDYSLVDGGKLILQPASGNVGIGTTNPSVKLQIIGADSAEGQLYVGNTDVTYSAGINFYTAASNRGFVGWRHTNSGAPFSLTGIHLFNTDNSNIVFGTNNTVKAVINVNGNVGIGVTNPEYKLDFCTFNLEQPTDHIIRFGVNNGPSGGGGSSIGTGIIWKPHYSNYTRRSAGIMQIAENNYFRAGLAFYTNGNGDQTTDWSERLRITNTGNTIFKSGTGAKYGTLTKLQGVDGNSSANISFDIGSELGVPSAGYVMVEISAIGYAGQGSGGLNYKSIIGGYSGHTVNSNYHKLTEYVNNANNNATSLYNPNNYTYGVSVTNYSAQGLNVLLKLSVTWY